MKNYSKSLLAATVTASVVASAVPMTTAAATGFTDVPSQYQEAVDFLVQAGANGKTATTFGTYENITRVDAAVFLANVLELDTENAADSGFKDVPARAVGAVNALKEAGITAGKTTDSFGSYDQITRGELAIWIQKGFGLVGGGEIPFTDVADSYQEAVKALYVNDITQGKSSSQFGVHDNAKRGDYAKFLYKAYETVVNSYNLAVMHTNDTHAHLDNVAKRITAIKDYRAEHPNSLLIDAGDVFSGTLYFNEFKGQADLQFMNYAGYDVMTFGNHEFDLGSTADGHKALADFIKGASFSFVSSNVDFSKDSNLKDLFKDEVAENPADGSIYNAIIKEVNGEKVGILGLTTEETVNSSSPGSVAFNDYMESAQSTVDALEAEGVNKIIAVSHLGYDDNPEYDNDLNLASYVDGIDIIVGGHTHTQLNTPVLVNEDENGVGKEPTLIVQAYQYSDYLGTLDVGFNEDGTLIGGIGELVKVADKAEDAEAATMLKKYSDQISTLMNTSTGATAAAALANPRLSDPSDVSVRNSETALGNLIADGMLAKAKEHNANTVIAMQNGGGIRSSIDQGDITVGEVLTVLPFGNTLSVVTLTGAEIVQTLEKSVSQAPSESGGFMHVSGLKFTYDSSLPSGSRVKSVEVKKADGAYTALDTSASYVVATNGFTAKGGDGYTVLQQAYENGKVTDLGITDWEIFRDYVKSLGTVDPKIEGRIVDVNVNVNN